MKTLFRAFALWITLAGLSWMLATSSDRDMARPFTAMSLFMLPALAVWLMARSIAVLPERWPWRIAFWAVTLVAGFVLLITTQSRAESFEIERSNLTLALALAGFIGIWLAMKARSYPTWRVAREMAVAVGVLVITGGAVIWSYDAKTRSIAAHAEVRWREIGLPMTEFEKTFIRSHENAGSEVVRQVLREQVNAGFYKSGSPAAEHEPPIEHSEATDILLRQVQDILATPLTPSDHFDLSSQTVTAIEAAAPSLEISYRRILGAEPAAWECDPRDGCQVAIPNFLGIRQFSQLAAADAAHRLSLGDQRGAAQAVAAALRVGRSVRENPTFVGLMIGLAVDGMMASEQVRLPASEGGVESLAEDVVLLRAEFLKRLQTEGWIQLRCADQIADMPEYFGGYLSQSSSWVMKIANRFYLRRQCAIAALNGAEGAAINNAPSTLELPDLGGSLEEAIHTANPSMLSANFSRAAKRIHATLLLREQTELIRDARARLATGRPVESRDSVVLPRVRWELSADREKDTLSIRLAGAPEWILKDEVTTNEFWVLPLDGSVAWQFHLPARTARQF
ncbi:MAG: hypothetical protein ABI680_04215 [Chthoniobacteraceae bacterium]